VRDGHRPDSFIWFARLVADKQPMRYVELARAVPEAHFVMIPQAELASVGEVETLRETARAIPNLELRDPLPHDQLLQLVAHSVGVVNTSTSEGMPNSFLEAWAQGVPVLTLQFDPDDVVARHGLGVAANGSWDRFVHGARELWEGRASRQKLAGRVRGYVEQTHSIEAVTARWSDLIREVATSH
jgi:glycosyltransferase involved in cell wall biosynthesis